MCLLTEMDLVKARLSWFQRENNSEINRFVIFLADSANFYWNKDESLQNLFNIF